MSEAQEFWHDPETGHRVAQGDGETDWVRLAETMQARRWCEDNLEVVEEEVSYVS